jgi:hypothetical protein
MKRLAYYEKSLTATISQSVPEDRGSHPQFGRGKIDKGIDLYLNHEEIRNPTKIMQAIEHL